MKLYNRKEIGAILKKAAENSSADGTDAPMGLSIDELQQVASDAGIDPEQIARAAAEIDLDSRRNERKFWGGPFSFNSQVLVDGEITVGQWEEMLISIRAFFQSKGQVTARESVWEWSSPWGTTNSAQVTVLKDNGKTRISVGWNGPLTAVPFYIPVPLAAIASIFFASEFLDLTAVPGVAFALLATVLTFLAGRWTLRRHLDTGSRKFQEMVSGLERIANRQSTKSEIVSRQTDPSQTQAEHPVLQMPEENSHDELDIEPERRNRSRT